MNRRSLFVGAGAVFFARPRAGWAQPTTKTARIGILSAGSLSDSPSFGAFLGQLRDAGWVDGQNLVVEYRWSERLDLLTALAGELLNLKVDVLVTPGFQAAKTARQATSSVPIVMIASTDPVAEGLVASIARPGGNLTGLSVAEPQLYAGKRLEMLKEAISRLSRVTVLWDATVGPPSAHIVSATDSAARTLSLQLQHRNVRSVADFDPAFRAAKTQRAGAILIMESPLSTGARTHLADLQLKTKLPLMALFGRIVEAGGLMSYGPSLEDLWRRAAVYVDKILRGARAGDLPVELPSKFELIINVSTAKALGLKIPQALLQRADRIVQ